MAGENVTGEGGEMGDGRWEEVRGMEGCVCEVSMGRWEYKAWGDEVMRLGCVTSLSLLVEEWENGEGHEKEGRKEEKKTHAFFGR